MSLVLECPSPSQYPFHMVSQSSLAARADPRWKSRCSDVLTNLGLLFGFFTVNQQCLLCGGSFSQMMYFQVFGKLNECFQIYCSYPNRLQLYQVTLHWEEWAFMLCSEKRIGEQEQQTYLPWRTGHFCCRQQSLCSKSSCHLNPILQLRAICAPQAC